MVVTEPHAPKSLYYTFYKNSQYNILSLYSDIFSFWLVSVSEEIFAYVKERGWDQFLRNVYALLSEAAKDILVSPFLPNVPFLCTLKTSENHKVVEKEYIGNKQVNQWTLSFPWIVAFRTLKNAWLLVMKYYFYNT